MTYQEEYVPTIEEAGAAMEDARIMMENMIRYGTIDKPKSRTSQNCSVCNGNCFVKDFECTDCEGTGWDGDVISADPCFLMEEGY